MSQAEYERAHREYLKQVQLSSHDEQESRKRRSLHVFEATGIWRFLLSVKLS